MATLSGLKRYLHRLPLDIAAEYSFENRVYCQCTKKRLATATYLGNLCEVCNLLIEYDPAVKNLQQQQEATMDNKQFEAIFHYITGKCKSILIDRAPRYADDHNRLRNFTNVSQEQHIMRRRIPNILSAKQREAYNTALIDEKELPLDMWEEWIVDQINYLILTYAIIKEESKNAPPTP